MASGYIVCLISVMFYADHIFGSKQASIFLPMGMLSLLVLSVSVMAFLFFYQPVIMLLEGKRQEAVTFFFKTVATFAIATALILLISIFASK